LLQDFNLLLLHGGQLDIPTDAADAVAAAEADVAAAAAAAAATAVLLQID